MRDTFIIVYVDLIIDSVRYVNVGTKVLGVCNTETLKYDPLTER